MVFLMRRCQATACQADIVVQGSREADVTGTFADISKAGSMLGWQPATPLADGLAGTVEWFRSKAADGYTIA